ncbi:MULTISPECIES: FeoB-associated Cys-rich membrane protein [Clostridia]|nr:MULTISPECIES: FeoB-associated Cys-rich membrane protein [Clostridia]MBW4847098.1 FeoB-associated Cys-rich membrane protein [Lachnospiraceae bacterium]MSS08693.1 FeoB-associated Cys-rich membrane protein [Clostridium sp. WB02_MRS01]
MGTLVVFIVVAGLVSLAVRSMINDKKSGKSIQCGGDCKHCGGHCH